MAENKSKILRAVEETLAQEEKYRLSELLHKEERRRKFNHCGGFLFGCLSDLYVDASEENEPLAVREKIVSEILELIQTNCKKGREGITHHICTHVKAGTKENENMWVVDSGVLRPIKETDDINRQGKTQGFCYSITHTDISVVDDQVYIGEVYGPLFGRGASCCLEIKNGVASFENPVEEWIS